MSAPRTNVSFHFRLPGTMLLRAGVGDWPCAPRGAKLAVAADGAVVVTSLDRHETFARDQVIRVARAFLCAIDGGSLPPTTLPALLHPGNGTPPMRYAITLGARISIAQTDFAPAIVAVESPARRRPRAAA